MKKIANIKLVLLPLIFLLLSSFLILPIQASIASQQIADKQITITNLPNGILRIETKYGTTTVEAISKNSFKTTFTNATGFTHVIEITEKDNKKSIIFDGVDFPVNQVDNSSQIDSKKLNENTIFIPEFANEQLPESIESSLQSLTDGSSVLSSEIMSTLTDDITYFTWDGINFVAGGSGGDSIKYPHPDKDYYGINIYSDWSISGNVLQHSMMNQATSFGLGTTGPAGVGAVIGAAVGLAIGGPYGALVGTIVGVLYAAYLYFSFGWQVQDENTNIWYWQSLPFLNWCSQNAWLIALYGPQAMPIVASAFLYMGYLRIGNLNGFDALGMGDPAPPPPPTNYYVSSIAQYTAYGSGAVNYPDNLIGSSNDGNYVQLYGGNPGDGGNIVGWMNQEAHGHIYLYGHSGSGYYTHLYTYVSYYNNGDWTQTSVQTVSGTNDRWIDCGSYSGNFRYLAIAAVDDNGMSANIFIDSAKVEG